MSFNSKVSGKQQSSRLRLIAAGGIIALAVCLQASRAASATSSEPTRFAAAATPASKTTEKLGQQLIGKLEGPEIITEPAKRPKKFSEAPMLAELVRAGKLPSVAQRLPEDPLVIKPVHQIGTYGGTWRRGFTGPADFENGNRLLASDKLLFVDYTGTKTVPSVARAWKVSDDHRAYTLFLRKGMKWSDGAPFTANDIMFWYTDLYSNKDLWPVPLPDMTVNGKPATIEKLDDYAVVIKFPDPHFRFIEIFRGESLVGAGQVTGTTRGGGVLGGYAPAHYLKQFHPKYVSKEELDKKAKAAGFDSWLSLFKAKNSWCLNPELPVLAPWRTTSPINTRMWVLERNPYYYAVDTEGNQLPYIDKIVMSLAENLEVLNLRAIAGEYDMQERHTQLSKLPVFLENQGKGGYKVHLDPAGNGSDAGVQFNLSYEADPEIAKWIHSADFRRALALGLDRDQFNEVFFVGVGTPGSPAPAESSPYSPGPEYRKLWSTYDPKKAMEMLDKIGLDKKDSEGYRLRTDGKGRLSLELTSFNGLVDWPLVGEMVKDQWRKIGIEVQAKTVERSLYFTRIQTNELQAVVWMNYGTDALWSAFDMWILPLSHETALGPLYAQWYSTGGQKGKKPADPLLLKAMELYRSAAGLTDEEAIKAGREIWRLHVDQQWSIGIVGQSPINMGVRIVKTNMGNIPERASLHPATRATAGSSHPETFFFKR